MSKNIIFPYVTFNKFVDEPLLKKLSLFYDKILVSESRFSILEDASKKELKEEFKELHYEYSVWQYLNENNVVSKYNNFNDINDSSDDIKELQDLMMSVVRNNNTDIKTADEKIQPLIKFYLSHDILARIDTLKFRKSDELNEYYSSLRNFGTFNTESKKNQVIQFILNDIPEPNNSTSWEQIIEYRSDLDVKNKYLALMNWINKVSNSNMKLSEIKDEYDYLYNDYMQQFKLHKMKYNNSKLEVILNATVNFITNISTGNYTTSIKDLFQFNVKNAQLLQEEAKLSGKELAYIYHTSLKFKNE
ncbi:hypothetical protein [Chishuiella sp.]|uniref:hypothetical protein n=1 Tax=Chishuiella sp. TaxID=1969467 RepID=UPI0028AB9517|nr:hypothetical protein [Chishuiella sp.]